VLLDTSVLIASISVYLVETCWFNSWRRWFRYVVSILRWLARHVTG